MCENHSQAETGESAVKASTRIILLCFLIVSGPAGAISKADLLACLRGEPPPSGVPCPER